ncbi:MAG: VOC family protein [Bosea sp.]|nr:VOC family protein [Bosea sp. (in: a-proteobacteria)]
MPIVGLDHVQIAMPRGAEALAREFYGGLLGLAEIPKPVNLAKRGGVWFALGDRQLHLGVEEPFNSARKAHPAFRVDDLESLRGRLRAAGHQPVEDEPLPGYRRFYLADPFGNRLEFLEPLHPG